MQAHKIKFDKTGLEPLQSQGYEGMCFTIQAVYYSSLDPSKHLHIVDADNDPVCYPIPGGIDPKLISIDPITVKLPLRILDKAGGNSVLIRGVLARQSL